MLATSTYKSSSCCAFTKLSSYYFRRRQNCCKSSSLYNYHRNKRQQQQGKIATTTWTQPRQTSINHSNKQNPTATPQNTPKQHDLSALQKKTAPLLLYRSSKESFGSPVFTLGGGHSARDSYQTLVAFHQSKRSIFTKLTLFEAFIGGSICSRHRF